VTSHAGYRALFPEIIQRKVRTMPPVAVFVAVVSLVILKQTLSS
jgi:hypothetical protein